MKQVAEFVGIPYGFRDEPGLDCYQLVVRVLNDVFGKQVPDYTFKGTWQEADQGFTEHKGDFEEVSSPQPGDVVLLRIGHRPIHCGIIVGSTTMLHSLRGSNSCIERFNTSKWRSRIEGFYRWNG
jgi:cell wall-associated NlpC family hydrolase